MKFRVLGCSGGQIPGYQLSSYIIDERLLVDSGSTTATLGIPAQRKIKDILITHIHLDHVMALGTLADNVYGNSHDGINLWSLRSVIEGLRTSFFNDRIWPDFTRIHGSRQPAPVIKLRVMPEGKRTRIANYEVTAVPVSHAVPSVAFFITRAQKTLLHVGDTGPTERVWFQARKLPHLSALVIEASFPNRLQKLADASGHLTPQTLAREIDKLGGRELPILVTHLKPEFRKELTAELKLLGDDRLTILNDGDVLRF